MANTSMDRPTLRGHAFWAIRDMRNDARIAAVGIKTATGVAKAEEGPGHWRRSRESNVWRESRKQKRRLRLTAAPVVVFCTWMRSCSTALLHSWMHAYKRRIRLTCPPALSLSLPCLCPQPFDIPFIWIQGEICGSTQLLYLSLLLSTRVLPRGNAAAQGPMAQFIARRAEGRNQESGWQWKSTSHCESWLSRFRYHRAAEPQSHGFASRLVPLPSYPSRDRLRRRRLVVVLSPAGLLFTNAARWRAGRG